MRAHRATKWRRTSLIVFFLITVALCFTGMQDALASNFAKESLRPGSWSLQFGIGNDFRLQSFDGLMISCKRHYSANSAIRLGVDLSAALRNSKSDLYTHLYPVYRTDEDADGLTIDVSAMYLYYPSSGRRVNLFLGIGPDIGYWRDKSVRERMERQYDTGIDYMETRSSYRYAIHAGAKGALGVEWFATKDISLLAEYGAVMAYSYSFAEHVTENHGTGLDRYSHLISRQLQLTHSSVKFGLSVYF